MDKREKEKIKMVEEQMKERLYMPLHYIPETARNTPVLFLAGPIQGTGDWQSEARKMVHTKRPDVIVASPRRVYLPGEFEYGKQVDWETYHLRRAAENGALLFWLAREEEHVPSRAYAQTSRFELAEWKMRREQEGVKLVIGIEKAFQVRNIFGGDFLKTVLKFRFSKHFQKRAKELSKSSIRSPMSDLLNEKLQGLSATTNVRVCRLALHTMFGG